MNVSAPPTSIRPMLASPASDNSERAVDGGSNAQDRSFGDILNSLDEPLMDVGRPEQVRQPLELASVLGSLERGHEFLSGTQVYSLQVEIGDNALAFQARPIVGVTSVVLPEGEVAVTEPPVAAQTGGNSIDTREVSPTSIPLVEALDREPAFVRLSTDNRPALAVGAKPPQVAPASGVPTTSVAPGQTPLDAASPQQPARPVTTRAVDAAEQAPSVRSEPQSARAMLFAQLLAAAGEYRVTVRGTQLTQQERERLIMDIRAALRSFGLADLPVSLSTSSGVA